MPSPTCPSGLARCGCFLRTWGIRHQATSVPSPWFSRLTLSVRNPEKEADPGGPCHPFSLKSGPIPHQPSNRSNDLKSVTCHDPCAVSSPEASSMVYRPPSCAMCPSGSHPPLHERVILEPSGALAKGCPLE